MRRVPLVAALILALAPMLPAPAAVRGGVAAVLAQAERDSRFALGVLRRDGVVIPFASFDRGWVNSWPADVRGLDLPITLDDVPKRWWGGQDPPAEMIAWADGRRIGTVRLEKPAMLPVMCMPRIALRTDYKSAQGQPPLMAQPFPKDGLVISGGHAIEALETVDRSSSDWSAAAVSLLGAFNEAEETAARDFTRWRHPISPRARQQMTLQLEALYRAPMDEQGWTAYYVEAVRRYPPGPEDDGCGLVTFVTGWVRLPPEGSPKFDLSGSITYCDRKGSSYMLPLGRMTVDRKIYWIYQISGFDREWYVIARPTSRAIEIHAQYPAGACPTL